MTRTASACAFPARSGSRRKRRVRSYPIVSRYGLLWVWMGDADSADPSRIFPVEHWGDAAWGMTRGDAMTVHCNYLYMTDNLLDPSHVAWVHPDSFGNAACESTPVQVKANESGVIASRWMRAVEVAPLYVPFVRFHGLCDRLQHYEVRFPSHALIKAVFVPAGAGDAEAERHERAFIMDSYNFLTPDRRREHPLLLVSAAQRLAAMTRRPRGSWARACAARSRRTGVILNAVQQSFAETRTPHIDIAIDSAPLRFRRRLRQLIAAEQPEASPRAALRPRRSYAGSLRIRWRIFALMFGFGFVAYLQQKSITVAAVPIMPELGLTQLQIGWLEQAYANGYALFMIPAAILAATVRRPRHVRADGA